jgi:hypothetical protein
MCGPLGKPTYLLHLGGLRRRWEPSWEPFAVDGCGRRCTRKPFVSACVDAGGHPWIRLGDLRIRRLGVELGEFAKSLRVYSRNPCVSGGFVVSL